MLYSAKVKASLENSRELDVHLRQELDDRAVYIHSTLPGYSGHMHKADVNIDAKYLDRRGDNKDLFRVESYLSAGMASHNMKTNIRCFFVHKCNFPRPNPTPEESRQIDLVADSSFLAKISPGTKVLYQRLVVDALNGLGCEVDAIKSPDSDCIRLAIAYRRCGTSKFLTAVTDLYHYYEFYSEKKFVESLSNGINIMSIYLRPIPGREFDVANAIDNVVKEVSMVYSIPDSPFQSLFREGLFNAQELMYATSGFVFSQHFLNRLGHEYWNIKDLLNPADPQHQQILSKLKKRLRNETFTVEFIRDIVQKYPEVIKRLYINFSLSQKVKPSRRSLSTISPSYSTTDITMSNEDVSDYIDKNILGENEKSVLKCFLSFNKSIMKTNFYQASKIAFSYRLNSDFLPESEYPIKPFGIFLVVGNEFRGFHVRFQDIARGGIRIVRSRNSEVFSVNRRFLFDENYALALTQNRKNKDIPEGGSKGTILLEADFQDSASIAFKKYIDAMLDLLAEKKDRRETPEIIFFGPDEGTADFMDWASEHAKKRGLTYWKAVTTGKSQSRGGIPHDIYGMTTRSVHQYVTGIYRKLDLDETEITKFQTGGPDGDLGSNEIKISREKTIGIIDGSGVLYDPEGIDKEELLRLAQERKMIANFDLRKLGPKGARVLVDENNATLPNGDVVQCGLEFRNNFHLNELSSADIFVPCGGRPEAVDISNFHKLLHEDGTPRFKYIVEGANLFFTQEARIRLEKAGIIIFKDASANKGGVTSSSLEVLSALAFTDAEFEECMTVRDDIIPDFYREYVIEVQNLIELNAKLEFECLWRESTTKPNGKTRSEISDDLSLAILDLNLQIQSEKELWGDTQLRKAVLSKAFPKLLQEKLGGIDELVKRLPENYQKAVFGSFLSSRFIYQFGPCPSQLAFFEYMSQYMPSLELDLPSDAPILLKTSRSRSVSNDVPKRQAKVSFAD